MNFDKIVGVCEKHGIKPLYNEKLSDYTTFHIGGACDLLAKPNSAGCAAELISVCRGEAVPYYIFGRGSNVLVSDEGLRGVVIVLSADFSEVSVDGCTLICEAGATLHKICGIARSASLAGMEFAFGIPGTVGGALCMNAGAYGGEMSDIAVSARCLDANGVIVELTREQMCLEYRNSVFLREGLIVLSVTIQLKKGNPAEISERMNMLMEKRRANQPLEYASAGSTFKRPDGDFAARLIEASGLKGVSCGDAEVSSKHSGFIVNKGNASFADVMSVVNEVKKRVYDDSGIMLECEMRIYE